jgi:hypothetical protein
MSRKFPKKVKRCLKAAEADRALLRKIVKAHEEWANGREDTFRSEFPSYDPFDGDQPCIDAEMNDYDEMETQFAYDAQNELIDLAVEVRKHLEESK